MSKLSDKYYFRKRRKIPSGTPKGVMDKQLDLLRMLNEKRDAEETDKCDHSRENRDEQVYY